MNRTVEDILEGRLRRLEESGLRRVLRLLEGRPGAHCRLDGLDMINFTSNDYLGLAGDGGAAEDLARAVRDLGIGAGASRLVGGHHAAHVALERAFAGWLGKDDAVFFPSGYHANIAVLTALCGPGDTVFSDELNHASIVDGCRLSGAGIVVHRHCDHRSLAEGLAAAPETGLKVAVTESLFSADGDEPPLAEIARLRREHGFFWIVDEAHAVGCYGPGGRGICAESGVLEAADLVVGTFGKAFGAFGAAAACGMTAAELIRSRGRTFMFTTATPPALTELVRLAFNRGCEAEERREALARNMELFRGLCREPGLKIPGGRAICPVIAGEAGNAVNLMNALWERGFYVHALRPPTVPAGTCRLRVTISAAHSTGDIEGLAAALAEVLAT
jgi:8-amino-7-oxononanoate synthase